MVTAHPRLIAPSPTVLRFLRSQLSAQSSIYHSPPQRCSPKPLSRQCVRAFNTARHTDNPRTLSTSSSLNDRFWRRLRPQKYTKSQRQHNDLPSLPGFLDDSSSSLGGRIMKPSHDLRLRCTEFDENGNVTLVNGEFRKSELMDKYSLLPRDLRKIDSSVLPHILVRESAILINLLHLRCLIKHNRVLVFDVYGSTDSHVQSLFMYDLEGKLRQKHTSASSAAGGNNHLPYEFRALEAVLISVTSGLESEFEGVREPVVRVLRELEEDIDRDKLRHLLIYSKKLGTFEQKARLVRDAIEDLLEADDDLASMYLTEKAQGRERDEQNHDEVELLLESYHKISDEIVQVSSNLVSAIRNTEEIVRAILDANRNSLMLLDLKFSIGTLGISAGMFIAALYGMNLKNFIEEDHFGFAGISGLCTAVTVFGCMWAFRRLRSVQRLSMWGESGSHKRPRAKGAQLTNESYRSGWGEIEPWERREHLRHEHGPTGQHLHGGARGLAEAVENLKQKEKVQSWKDKHAWKNENHPRQPSHVDGALPPMRRDQSDGTLNPSQKGQ